MIEIATKLAPRIRTILDQRTHEHVTHSHPHVAPHRQPHVRRSRPAFRRQNIHRLGGRHGEDFAHIENGEIVAGKPDVKQPRNEFLCTTRDYADFELRLEYRRGDNNGGIQFRSERHVPKHHEVSGYQADFARVDGCLYDESRRNRFLAVFGVPEVDLASEAGRPAALSSRRKPRAENEKKLKIGEWNRYRIRRRAHPALDQRCPHRGLHREGSEDSAHGKNRGADPQRHDGDSLPEHRHRGAERDPGRAMSIMNETPFNTRRPHHDESTSMGSARGSDRGSGQWRR